MAQEWTVAELAEEWGCRVETVRHTLRRAGVGWRVIGRTWLVNANAKSVAEAWRKSNARR